MLEHPVPLSSATSWWRPTWVRPLAGVNAVQTTRALPTVPAGMAGRLGGLPPYDAFNLGDHVGDAPDTVAAHRAALAAVIGAEPVWLKQVHGHEVVRLTQGHGRAPSAPLTADGSLTTEPGVACTIMVADCLPVLLAAPQRRGVAALHAGWRGLAGAGADMAGRGVLEEGVASLCEAAHCDPADLQAWLGPCIGPSAFEVGREVLEGFGVDPDGAHPRFVPQPGGGTPARWLADLPGLAADRLMQLGVRHISGGQWCTVSDRSRFFSFRRDGVTGRQAACIWLEP